MTTLPPWMADLDEQDLAFIKRFILASGSLKEAAAQYGVSYPTVRLRLDRLIQKIRLSDTAEADPFVSLVKRLAVDDKLDFETAKLLIDTYRSSFSREKKKQKERSSFDIIIPFYPLFKPARAQSLYPQYSRFFQF